jgi:4-hydroxy-3-polyprenylbenzoate decarboxylase
MYHLMATQVFNMSEKLPLIVAMTGASGSIYGLRLLQYLLSIKHPVELCVSAAAKQVMRDELDLVFGSDKVDQGSPPSTALWKTELLNYLEVSGSAPLVVHSTNNYGASIASGSYSTMGMAIVPCSGGTLGALASGLTENLIHRAGAVCLKERRKLLVLLREMPFGHIQLKNMLALSEAGAIVSCASPGFYHKPNTISDQIDFVVGRVLDQFGFEHSLFKRWQESAPLLVKG